MKFIASCLALLLVGFCGAAAQAEVYKYDIVGSGGALLGTITYDPADAQSGSACVNEGNLSTVCLGVILILYDAPPILFIPENAAQGPIHDFPVAGFNQDVTLTFYLGNDDSIAYMTWAIKYPGDYLDPPGSLPPGEGDPIIESDIVPAFSSKIVPVVPEPSTISLALLGLTGLTFVGLRSRGGGAIRA